MKVAIPVLLPALLIAGCHNNAAQPAAPAAPDSQAASAPEPASGPAVEAAPAPAPAGVPQPTIDRPLLWRITSPENKTAYVLGTIHLGVDAVEQLPELVWQHHRAADVFVMEADVSDPALLAAMQRTDGKRLRDDIGAAAFAKLEKVVGPAMAAGLDGMKASAATTVIMIRGMPITPPMDVVLHQKARAAGKRLAYLEPVQLQLDLIDRFLGSEALIHALDNITSIENVNKSLLAAYLAGDGDQLAAVVRDQNAWPTMGKEAIEAMVFARNRSWVPVIEKLVAESGTCFIAVGGGHLVGEQNVLALLEARGFQVERVTGRAAPL